MEKSWTLCFHPALCLGRGKGVEAKGSTRLATTTVVGGLFAADGPTAIGLGVRLVVHWTIPIGESINDMELE